jgi:N-acetylmuramoyl-L-alanine amidase
MPKIYLSPSTQEYNYYINGGTEEQYMNLIADYMEPYLVASGVEFERNTPDMTAASSIAASNAGNFDLHLAIHSNAAPESLAGRLQGTDVYYSPRSVQGKRAAEIIAENFKKIYPDPALVKAVPTTSIGEVTRTRAPAVLIEVAYHDNLDDANWIKNNLRDIARNLAQSVTEFLGVPFVNPQPQYTGVVTLQSGSLNIRSRPTYDSAILAQAPNGAELEILGSYDGWYVVNYQGTVGYARSEFITIL